MSKARTGSSGRWHPTQESDELIFAICDHFFFQLGVSLGSVSGAELGEERQRGAAASVAAWVNDEMRRPDITREKIYPLFWEAFHRGFLMLQPPLEKGLADRIYSQFDLKSHPGEITVVNVTGASAAQHVTSTAADMIVTLIDQVFRDKRKRFPNAPEKQSVHLGMGAGYAAMLVAKRLAQKVNSGEDIPPLVLHAISAGGFLPQEPHKAPTNYFTYFDPSITNVKYVALFSETVVDNADYEKLKTNPGIKSSYECRDDIDIVVTSLAAADHKHGLLVQYLTHLVSQKYLKPEVLTDMQKAGWLGDVQFRPYSNEGPITEVCPVRAVTLFELEDLVRLARDNNGKYVVLVAGPCGECGESKQSALRPLLANENLRLWTHLVTDSRTARELLEVKNN
ncbi:MAG: sugar-binding domain-containing protein [Planctomycetaceae bacterium]|jgi:DNA-binding transcriptional regulator LsrR (DeoR family)|nr:sugar-binding domain-containing protein [Planctomycetaceae bacterium]